MEFDQASPIQYEWMSTKSPPSLQSLAMDKLVTDLWRRVLISSRDNGTLIHVLKGYAKYQISCDFRRRNIEIKFSFTDGVERKTNQKKNLSIFSEIEIILQRRFLALQLNTIEWLMYHYTLMHEYYKNTFTDLLYIFECFDNLIFDGNDNIDYVATAREMVKCNEFVVADKYLFACQYCFESDVEKLWPPISDPMWDETVDDQWLFSGQLSLVTHWTIRMKEKYAIKFLQPANFFADNATALAWHFQQIRSNDQRLGANMWDMIFYDIVDTTAVPFTAPWNYILYRKENTQFKLMKIKSKLLASIARYGFSELSQEIFERIAVNMGHHFMIWFMNNEELWQFAIPYWFKIKHLMNGRNFVDMFAVHYVIGMGKEAFDVHPQKLFLECQSAEITDEFLEETAKRIRLDVWFSAPIGLREFAVNHYRENHALHTLNFLY